jgi:hypothetical protein
LIASTLGMANPLRQSSPIIEKVNDFCINLIDLFS